MRFVKIKVIYAATSRTTSGSSAANGSGSANLHPGKKKDKTAVGGGS
jgi:hypothetical protein